MKYIIVLFVTVLSFNLYSKEVIPRAEDLINPDKVKQTIYYIDEEIYFTTPDMMANKKVIRSFHSSIDPSSESIKNFDNDILDFKTLRPLFKKHPKGTIEYHYLKDNVVRLSLHHHTDSDDVIIKKEVKIPNHNYVISGPSVPVLITALPLKVGLKVRFNAIDTYFPYSKDYEFPVIDYLLEVTGSEVISLNENDYYSFIVEIYPEKADVVGVYFKAWITKEIPHMEIQGIYTSSENKKKDNSKLIYRARKIIRLS